MNVAPSASGMALQVIAQQNAQAHLSAGVNTQQTDALALVETAASTSLASGGTLGTMINTFA
ncbi:hypothetical protein [Pararobbsia alpina]|jgi:hypothetical protein|uniref:Motility protein n=1 Tax=Pararobbsia alpina TaxID=621374 RepID=A0A6S7BKV3_9BURK|nr:hypothetical protein [Pararobbsia alpina]CAB3789590.1 hypothetical protein LMG28138_02823 [Pararobbsia alpina]